MRRLFQLLAWIMLFVSVAAWAQQDNDVPPSLGEVARQNRERKKAAEQAQPATQTQTASLGRALTDEAKEPTESPIGSEPSQKSLCGDPLPIMQETYASAFVGQKPPSDDQLGKALTEWLAQHPGLETISPDELAAAEEPRTSKQYWSDYDLAGKIAGMFTQDMVEFREKHTEEEVNDKIVKLLTAKMPARQADVLERAVRDEKQRRAAMKGKGPSDEDRLAEAINLYSICENKRLIGSQDEVDKQTKLALRTKLEQAGFKLPEIPVPTPAAKAEGE